jgi:hypothetical protein
MWENTEHPADQTADDFAGYSDWLTDLGFFAGAIMCCVALCLIVMELLA